MSFGSRKQVAEKIEWEGGVMEALDYGLTCADMPDGDDELIKAWDDLATAYAALAPLANRVEQLLATPGPAEAGEASDHDGGGQ